MLGFELYFYHLPVGLKAGAVVAAGGMSRLDAYRVFLAGFTLVVGPFVFFNVTKTKYLQILTTIMRYLNNQSQLLLVRPTYSDLFFNHGFSWTGDSNV